MKLLQIKALLVESKQTGRPIQQAMANGSWVDLNPEEEVGFKESRNYRVAPPEPPRPREWWIQPDPTGGESQAWDASPSDNDKMCKQDGLVRVREVMEDSK